MPWRRLYLDLPWAAGSTGSAAASALDVANEVLAAISDHLGDEPFALVGQSYGGMLARHIAHVRRGQVLGLATIAGVTETEHRARRVPERTVLVIEPAALERAGDAREAFTTAHVVQTTETLDAFITSVLPGERDADQAVMERIAARYSLPVEPEIAHPLPFTAPSLHVFGRQDDVVGYEDGWLLREHYPPWDVRSPRHRGPWCPPRTTRIDRRADPRLAQPGRRRRAIDVHRIRGDDGQMNVAVPRITAPVAQLRQGGGSSRGAVLRRDAVNGPAIRLSDDRWVLPPSVPRWRATQRVEPSGAARS
ncbi:alpha/beta hydrolase [Curtobacterium sp. MCPF17_052]|nr:alpha/beta hydrolase [Curtobacterium sp. MCPF17_052]WIB13919.1 alpha/beta hydrolase [Curtobacterium sp. MCPF17_052]